MNAAACPPEPMSDRWHLSAACRGQDIDLFYPPDDERGGFALRRVARAKAVCGRCPVISPCLNTALTSQERHGIWGGLTPDERDAVPL